jgi:uncharacterized membrane protein
MTGLSQLRNSFIAGLVLILPLIITLYILQMLVGFTLGFIDPVVQQTDLAAYTANVEVIARLIAVLLILSVITLLGFLAQRELGQHLFGSLGRTVTLIPLVRTIYSTVRQISTSVSNKDTSYDSLVVVEYPRKNMYSIGLVTNDSPQEINDVADTTARNVFLPSSPNPAGGRLVFVPEAQIYEVDLSVRQGLGLIMTTGATSDQSATAVPGTADIPSADTLTTSTHHTESPETDN